MSYAELHCLTHFTFLRGASHPEELVARARRLGYAALAITDECSVAGVVRAHMAAKNYAQEPGVEPLKLLIGSEFRLTCGTRLVALARNRRGYARLCSLITRGRRAAPKGQYALSRADVEECLDDCLILWLPQLCGEPGFDAAAGRWLKERFAGSVWIAVELACDGADRERRRLANRAQRELDLPLLASGNVHMHVRARRRLQDALTAIRLNIPIREVGWELHANGERHLRSPARLARLYPPEWLAETLAVAKRCEFSLDELRYEYPRELVPPGQTPTSHLRALVEQGALTRWPGGLPQKARQIIEYELELIADLRYEPYFLTVQDIVAYARSRGILCQGRGSAANSIVCYCLGVTAIGPERGALLIERFISRERDEPPDIDIDFEHERREEVLQYVYGKYGRERAALAATVIAYRPRSALRDLGKAFGLPPEEVDRLARIMQWWDPDISAARLREAGFDPGSPLLAQIIALARELVGFPRHLSQHVGGFVISAGPLEELVPTENAAMAERTVVQWDKDDLNDLGLLKVDLLGLGMLTALRRALALVNTHRGTHWSLGHLPAEDPAVYDMMGHADTVGVFQIESRAQMSMLPRLKPRCYQDLVIEVAIVRPGPIQGDMVHPYLRRREGKEPVEYPSEEVRAILERTLGVPIFQEQVMQLAMKAAGFTPGEADRLRRAMAAWKRHGDIHRFQEKLVSGMLARGYAPEFAQRLCKQIQGFGEYGFPECVVGGTRVVDADSGRWVRIEDVACGRARLECTLSCDDKLRLRKRKVLAVLRSGEKTVWRLRTALGHTLVATAEHPLLTMQGWQPLGQLQRGDFVAVARIVPVDGTVRWDWHKIVVLAGLIAEGNLCHPSTFYFYTKASNHCDDFVRAVERFPNTRAVIEWHKSCYSVRVRRIDRHHPIGAVAWIRELGIWGHDARHKFLPSDVFEQCAANISLLLARLWDGDGGVDLTHAAYYDTASERLSSDVQHLLLRLGIVARVYRRSRLYKGQMIKHYVVTVTDGEALRKFWQLIGCQLLNPRKRQRSKVLAGRRDGRMSLDVVPVAVHTLIREARDSRGLTWNEIGRRTGLAMREIQSRSNLQKNGFRRFVIQRLGACLQSAALDELATSDIYWDKIVSIERQGVEPTYDLKIEGDHNFLANNLVVHNSHAASFALLVYDSGWLKCHEPAAFTCALLNSQPMGFYAPAQLVRDARAHGVEVRPVSVCVSTWDCALEPAVADHGDPGQPALRLGLRLVKSLSQLGAERLVAARNEQMFASVQDLARRAQLDRDDLEALAAAGALAPLTGNRHLAFWEVAGTERALPLAPRREAGFALEEGQPLLRAPTERESMVADYASLGLTLGRHPLAFLRDRLSGEKLATAGEIARLPDGKYVRTAGLVLMRQHPGSANGVTFVTLEDETGQVNLIVWESVGQTQRRPLVESRLLEVRGHVQRQGEILHLIAQRLIDRSALLDGLTTRSRDFH